MTDDFALVVLNVLSTYLLHSTLLLLGAWAIVRAWPGLSDRARENITRIAFVSGVLTTLLQCTTGLSPISDLLRLDIFAGTSDGVAGAFVPVPMAGNAAAPVATGGDPTHAFGWPTYVMLGYLGAVFVQVAMHLAAGMRLRRLLADREPVTDPGLLRQLAALRREVDTDRQVVLSCSARIPGPIAFGVWRPEICLSKRAVENFDASEIRCVLAHELAHILHRDPLWTRIHQTIAILGFFQPLHRVVRRRLYDLAELRCDAFVIARDGDGIALAGTLLRVAEWQRGPLVLSGIHTMATRPSCLARRVQQALASPTPIRSHSRVARLALPALLAAFAWAAPGLDLRGEPSEATFTVVPHGSGLGYELQLLRRQLHRMRATLTPDDLDPTTVELIELIRTKLDQAEQAYAHILKSTSRSGEPGSEPPRQPESKK